MCSVNPSPCLLIGGEAPAQEEGRGAAAIFLHPRQLAPSPSLPQGGLRGHVMAVRTADSHEGANILFLFSYIFRLILWTVLDFAISMKSQIE